MTLKVLIADDSVTIQKIVTLAFGCEDAVVECVSDGSAALDAIRSFGPDVVLADVFMPGANGYEICERMKDDQRLAHIPVILIAGTFEPFDEKEASRVKCDGHLIKPFDTAELIETVYSLAENQRANQNSDTSVEAPAMDMHLKAAASPELPRGLREPVNLQVWDSYLGSDRILDLFDPEILKDAESMRAAKDRCLAIPAAPKAPETMSSVSPGEELSEDAINHIVDRVVQRMSADVVREVAWEVVPELAENIIRGTIEERNKH